MGIEVFQVRTQAELRAFIRLPAVLPGRRPNYVPPIWSEEKGWHDPGRNPLLRDQATIRFLARSNGRLVGRIMGLVHKGYNASHNERTARFYQLEAIDDQDVVRLLLSRAEAWAREQGMDRIIGPFGLSDKDPQGMQVEGFEHLPVIATPTNPTYLPALVEALGYAKHADCLSYRMAVPETVPERYERVAQHVLRSEGLTVKTFKDRKELKRWIVPVLELVNNTYTELLGFVPMTRAEMQKLATDYLPLLDPELVVVVVDLHEVPVAFVVAVPDLSPGLQPVRLRVHAHSSRHEAFEAVGPVAGRRAEGSSRSRSDRSVGCASVWRGQAARVHGHRQPSDLGEQPENARPDGTVGR